MTDNWCSYTNYMEMVGRGMGVGCVMEEACSAGKKR